MVHNEPGILRQMSWEQSAAEELGIPWTARLCTISDLSSESPLQVSLGTCRSLRHRAPAKVFRWAEGRIRFINWLREKASNYDLLVLRYNVGDPIWAWAAVRLGKPIVTVHHTMEGPELSSGPGLKRRLKAFIDAECARYVLPRASAIIGVTREIVDYQKTRVPAAKATPALLYPNGIQTGSCSEAPRTNNHVPQLLFVAARFANWHGLDRLLDSVFTSTDDFALHLVGELNTLDKARALTDDRIKLHGVLSSAAVEELCASADIGLSSFALDRNNMQQACTLKVREYLACGVPVYAGHSDVFPVDFAYYQNGGADIACILQFCKKLRAIPRHHIAEAARPYISKIILLQSLYNKLCNLHRMA